MSRPGGCLIVGAAGGIGEACVRRFAAEGCSILMADVAGEALSKIADSVGSEAGRSSPVPFELDVADPASVASFRKQMAEGEFSIDTVIYTAGFLEVKNCASWTEEDYRGHFEVNCIGAARLIQAVIPRFPVEGGSITVISSVSARIGFAGLALYCASKAGLEGLVRGLVPELSPREIRINAVAPTMVDTPMMWKELQQREARGEGSVDELYRECAEAQPIPRFASAEEIAELCFQLSSRKLGLMTGAVIPYDGGMSAACQDTTEPRGEA